MITIENVVNLYPQIDTKDLPELLVNDFPFVSTNIELYHDDEDIKACLDMYVQKLDECLVKNGYCLVDGKLEKGFTPVKDIPKYEEKPTEKKKTSAKKTKSCT